MQALHLLQLALTMAMVALLPLAWVWVSTDPDKFRKLVWVAVFFTFDLIVFGAFTRLTDSGLGCPDWPGCYGHANPLQASGHIDAAAAALPSGPVTRSKAWIEMIHRYLAGAIGVLCLVLCASAWRIWRRRGLASVAVKPWLSSFLVFWVGLQGAFGAWTVTLKLQPIIVTLHLLLGMGLLALLAWLAAHQEKSPPLAPKLAGRLRPWIWLASIFLFCQLALGGWVSTNYATLACTEFPMCQGQWLPTMDFDHGFSLWRELGKTGNGEFLPFAALTAIHWVHRGFAWLLVMVLLGLVWQIRRLPVPTSAATGADASVLALRKLAHKLLWVLLLQLASGLATIFLAMPLAIAVLHNAGAALLVLLLTMLHYRAAVKSA
jgi:cytochrome c oxidase assembly protein subunit 15